MPCSHCGFPHPLMRGTLCDPCYKYKYMHGVDRPASLFKPHNYTKGPGVCCNCKAEAPRLQRDRCVPCYAFKRRNGYDRPPGGIRRKRTKEVV